MRLRAAVSRRRAEVWREALLGRREGGAALQLRGTSCRTALGALRSHAAAAVAARGAIRRARRNLIALDGHRRSMPPPKIVNSLEMCALARRRATRRRLAQRVLSAWGGYTASAVMLLWLAAGHRLRRVLRYWSGAASARAARRSMAERERGLRLAAMLARWRSAAAAEGAGAAAAAVLALSFDRRRVLRAHFVALASVTLATQLSSI